MILGVLGIRRPTGSLDHWDPCWAEGFPRDPRGLGAARVAAAIPRPFLLWPYDAFLRGCAAAGRPIHVRPRAPNGRQFPRPRPCQAPGAGAGIGGRDVAASGDRPGAASGGRHGAASGGRHGSQGGSR